MTGKGEFRRHWRPLAGAVFGMGSGLLLNNFILSSFAPYLIEDFGWTRSQWAMIGFASILMILCQPLAGQLTDRFGVRAVATVGALAFPLSLWAFTFVDGNLYLFLAIYIAQLIICSTTTATVYSRVVAEHFDRRRGAALAIIGSSPALVGALGSVWVTGFVAEHGWRAGYAAIAAFCLLCALLAIALLPPVAAGAAPRARRTGVYRDLARLPAARLMLLGCFLVTIPFALATTSLKIVILDQGISDAEAAGLIAIFALGSIAGRFAAGVALDYVSAHLVGALSFLLPVAGLLLLASGFDSVPAVGAAILCIGLAMGSEVDVIPYLVTRHFPMAIFSTALGVMTAGLGLAIALGNVLMSISLEATGSFDAFLYAAALLCLVGSACFLLLRADRYRFDAVPDAPDPVAAAEQGDAVRPLSA